MAPLSDKNFKNEKCCSVETTDNKAGKVSWRWLLRRSKSSKSAKEMAQPDQTVRDSTIPSSKSCDSGMLKCKESDNFTSAFFLWRLLPSRAKAATSNNCDWLKTSNSSNKFKTSFSTGDVHGMMPSLSNAIPTTKSSYVVPSGVEISSIRRTKANKPSTSCKQQLSPDNNYEVVPHVCHLTLCKLCLGMLPDSDMYQLEECGCVFCLSCMKQYLLVNIKEGNVMITCPDAQCGVAGSLQISEVEELVGGDAFGMFQRFKLNREVELDPNRTWCPGVGCESICYLSPSQDSNKGFPVHCITCGLTFCSLCKQRWHASRTCEELRKELKDEDDFLVCSDDDDNAIIKRCPNCRIPIERDEGCAQMMCKRCRHVFCWYCLTSLDDDFLLRHYDKGPCKNKLGHSRASVVWHRTQVVGIFAGFGFLLLVASPLLLLAAPCLLCCRCKQCKFFYEEPTPL